MPKIEFLLKNHRKDPAPLRVLVFLRPEALAEGALFHAWQTLGPPPRGGSRAFALEGRLAVTAAEDRVQGSSSARWSIQPGQPLAAHRRNGQGPELSPCPGEAAPGGPARVLNQTGEPLLVTWYCDGNPILRQTVDPGAAAELRLSPADLLFLVQEPSRNGLYQPADVLRQSAAYRVPDRTGQVDILWSRSVDDEKLLFDPPPAPLETPSEPEAGPRQEPATRKRKS